MQLTTQTTTLTIRDPHLQAVVVTVSAESTAEVVLYTPTSGGNTWMALEVDGSVYPLVLWKHTVGQPAVEEALSRALAEVQAAIGRCIKSATVAEMEGSWI